MRLGVNGRFYGVPVWGVQRFAREVTGRLLRGGGATLFLPGRVPEPAACPTVPVRGRLSGHPWEQVELPWRARREGCDVVLHLSGTGPIWGGPNVVAIHDVLPLTNPEWFSRSFVLWHRTLVRAAARRAAAILTPSEWARSELVRVLGVDAGRARVVGQGIEPFDEPATEADVGRARERFGLPSSYLLALGGGDRRKNPGFLLRTLDRWQELRGDAPPLVLVGAHRRRVHGRPSGGPPRSSATRQGAGPRVFRLGYVEDADLRALYTGARVFCFPSLAEGYGRPPLEAMACGTPAVVAEYGAAREVLGEAALILPLDPDAWIDAISGLLEEGDGRRERVLRGRRHALGLRWAGAVQAVVDACTAVVGPAGEAPGAS